MYDEPGKAPHGLPHDPFKSCVVPRPMGRISKVDVVFGRLVGTPIDDEYIDGSGMVDLFKMPHSRAR